MIKNNQLTLICCIIVAMLLLLTLTMQLNSGNGLLTFNAEIYQFIERYRNLSLTKFFSAITLLGDKRVLLSTLLISFGWMFYLQEKRVALHWLLLGLFAAASILIIKELVDFPRPISSVGQDSLPAFPSGHTALSITIIGFLAYLSTRAKQAKNIFIYSLAITFIVLVILSRLYLSSHWFTDVIGGILLGFSWLMAGIVSHRFLIKQVKPLPGLLAVTMTGLFIVWLIVLLI